MGVLAAWAWLAGPLPAQEPPISPDLVVLHFNDFHGQLLPWGGPGGQGGIAVLASFVRRMRAEAERKGFEVWVTDGGDWFQGTPEGNETGGSLPLDFMNRLGLSLAVLGNHEFDFGHENAQRLVSHARYPVLAANLERKGSSALVSWIRPYQVRAIRGVRIGVLGLVTSKTPSTSTGPFGNCAFRDELATIERWLPRLRAEADAVLLLTHCGLDRDREIARRFPEISVILGGHSHSSLKAPLRDGGTWILQTGGKGREIYRLDLAVDPVRRTIEPLRARNLSLDPKRFAADPEFTRVLSEASREIRARWDKPIGELVGDLGKPRAFGSTPAGNLIADLIRAEGKARIAIHNKGGIRRTLSRGPLTLRQIYELLPFSNTVVSMDLTGEELVSALREGLRWGRPLEVSGLRYEILTGDDRPAVGRVRLVGHEEVRPRGIYRVATNSFLARGGDGVVTFRKGRRRRDHGRLLRELLVERVQAVGRLEPPVEKRIEVLGR